MSVSDSIDAFLCFKVSFFHLLKTDVSKLNLRWTVPFSRILETTKHELKEKKETYVGVQTLYVK